MFRNREWLAYLLMFVLAIILFAILGSFNYHKKVVATPSPVATATPATTPTVKPLPDEVRQMGLDQRQRLAAHFDLSGPVSKIVLPGKAK